MGAKIGRVGRIAACTLLVLIGVGADAAAQSVDPPAHAPAVNAPPVPAATPPLPAPAAVTGGAPPAAETVVEAPDTAVVERRRVKPAPSGPRKPYRAPAAILRVLDKVSAQTMAFEAPVGRRIRFRNLVFEVKACETLGPDEIQPRTAAYLIVTSDAGAASSGALASRELFRGWMFADAPSIHPLKNPIYDAWLVDCASPTPPG